MIQKGSYLIPADQCGVFWVKVFHLYKGFSRKITFTGGFVKVSVKVTRPDNWVTKKTKLKGIVIRTKKEVYKRDGSFIKFNKNYVVLLKKRLTPKGKELYGPTLKILKRKKFLSSFSGVM